MAYRETTKIKNRKAATRERIVQCALATVAEGGFSALQMHQLAKRAGLATGTLYRYFSAKEVIATEVFRYATEIEVTKVANVLAATDGNAVQRIYAALNVFAERALRAPRMAWALIAEPVDPAVDQARLDYRAEYAELFAAIIQQGIAEGSFPQQPPTLVSTALVGAIAEALIGPLAPKAEEQRAPVPASTDKLTQLNSSKLRSSTDQSNPVPNILTFLMQALTGKPIHELQLPCATQEGTAHE